MRPTTQFFNNRRPRTVAIAAAVFIFMLSLQAPAAITWDSQELTTNNLQAGHGTQWWFDPFNWSGTGNTPGDTTGHFLPPSSTSAGTASTDTQINSGTGTLPGGEGVVFDPTNDPNFATAGSYNYPSGGFGPQDIGALYISRNTANANRLTIRGNLQVGRGANTSSFQVGRSGSTASAQNLGEIVQYSGTVGAPTTNLDLGSWEASGWGNGVYDYRGGNLDIYNGQTNHGIRISHGSQGNGTAGIGRLIVHNPATAGYVRTYDMRVASDRTNGDGLTRGVGFLEFHYENGNTRPVQVMTNLSLNNGLDNTPQGSFPASTRSSRLALILDAAPTVDGNGVPQTLGLIDVGSQGIFAGVINGVGDLDGDGIFTNDQVFSSADGTKNYYPRSAFTDPLRPNLSSQPVDNFLVSAIYNGIIYKWEVSYTGSITFSDPNTGTVGSVSDTGGADVVLKGVSSGPATSVPGDYNNNGVVDAADYVVWRKNQRTTNVLPNDPFGPLIGDSQFNLWRSNFGKVPGQGAGSSLIGGAVPEPATVWLAVASVFATVLPRRRRAIAA